MSKEKDTAVEEVKVVEEIEKKKPTPRKSAPKTPKAQPATTKPEEEKESVAEEVVTEDEAVIATEKPVRRKAVEIDLNAMIPIKSVTSGILVYRCPRTGFKTTWSKYGDIEYMEFKDILTIKSTKEKFLTEPYFVIEDDDAVEKLGLKDVYAKMFYVDNINQLLRLPLEKLELEIEKMPNGAVRIVRDKVTQLIKEEKLYDSRIINLLKRKLRLDLQLLED